MAYGLKTSSCDPLNTRSMRRPMATPLIFPKYHIDHTVGPGPLYSVLGLQGHKPLKTENHIDFLENVNLEAISLQFSYFFKHPIRRNSNHFFT